ncbi:hypothetical protein CSPX01_08443 [Colletotrichum filicis]|nr:hypothetical protein CSPX01_08443 [Colletotrichum filicis]
MLCKQMQATKLKTRTWVSDRRNPSQESQLSRRQCQSARVLPCLTFFDECSDLVRLVGPF